MSFTVYGIRLKGEVEVRYVGLTYKPIKRRLREHRATPCVPGLSTWLMDNWERAEVFAIASVTDREQARATEKVIITLCARLNHRLFNRTHVPTHLRWDCRTDTTPKLELAA